MRYLMIMGFFEVHAGDFKTGKYHQLVRHPLFFFNKSYRRWDLLMDSSRLFRKRIPLSQITELEVASEESVNRLGGVIGRGIIGQILLGPVGLLAGLLRGGKGNQITFVCKLKDGRKFLATAPSNVFSQMQIGLATFEFNRTHLAEQHLRNSEKIVAF